MSKSSIWKMTSKQIKEKIKLITDKSWFDLDRESDYQMVFSTRRHGDVGEEMAGSEDLREALRVKGELTAPELYGYVDVDVDDVDEWVFVNIEIIPD